MILCYNGKMDITIRNLDQQVYREVKARAALEGKTVGEVLNEAVRVWLGAGPIMRTGSLRDLRPQSWGPQSERMSEQVDRIVYGARS